MKKNIPTLIFILISIVGYSQTTINAGNVSGTWSKAGSPYLVQGDINVLAGQKLTITEGVKVEFQGAYRLRVYGSIQALGKTNDTVIFTPKDKNVGWKGIIVYKNNPTDDSIIFNNARFEFSKNFTYSFKTDTGVLHIQDNDKTAFSNVVFFKNMGSRYTCLRMTNSTFNMQNCYFMQNQALDDRVNGDNSGLSCITLTSCIGIINNTKFISNKSWNPNNPNDSATGQAGSACSFGSSNLTISNCLFDSNYATTAAPALAIIGTNSKISIDNCNFTNNFSREGYTLNCYFESNPNNQVALNNCLFDNNVSRKVGPGFPTNDIFMYSKSATGNSMKIYNTKFTNSRFISVQTFEQGSMSFYNCVWENNDVQYGCVNAGRYGIVNLYNCRITNNANGIYVFQTGKVNIYNSLVAFNGSDEDTLRYGFYVSDAPDKANIYNSIFSNNRSDGRINNIGTEIGSVDNGYINKIHNTIIEGGTAGTKHINRFNPIRDTAHILDAKNIINVTPTFVNPATTYGIAGFKPGLDFHLVNNCGNSPGYMHEQGTMSNLNVPSYDTFPITDFDGNPRIQCKQIDIGPYEIEGLANVVDVTLSEDTLKVCPETNAIFKSNHCGTAVTYQWQQQNGGTWSNLQTQTTQTVSQMGNYRVIAEQVACSTKDTAYGYFTNFPKPIPNLGADKSLNINDSLLFNPGSFSAYSWNNGSVKSTGKLLPVKNGDTLIWVEVTDANGCKGRDSVKITVSGVKNIELLSKLNIQAYPNPTNSILNFTGSENIEAITVYDVKGSVKLTSTKNTNHIDLSGLPMGIYILAIQTKEGVGSLRVVKE